MESLITTLLGTPWTWAGHYGPGLVCGIGDSTDWLVTLTWTHSAFPPSAFPPLEQGPWLVMDWSVELGTPWTWLPAALNSRLLPGPSGIRGSMGLGFVVPPIPRTCSLLSPSWMFNYTTVSLLLDHLPLPWAWLCYHSRDLLACIWNWALQGPWLVCAIGTWLSATLHSDSVSHRSQLSHGSPTALSSLTALLSQGTWSIGGWAPHGPGQTGFQGGLAGPLKGDVLVSRSALSFLTAVSSLTALLSQGTWSIGGWAPHGPGQTGFQGGLAGPLKGDVLVSRSAPSFLTALTAVSSLTALLSQGTWSIGGWAPHGPGQTGFQGGLAGPLKGDVLVSRSAPSFLTALTAVSSLTALLSQGTWSIGGWAPHGPGQTGFQGGLAGPLKGDVLVSRSALSFLIALTAVSSLTALLSQGTWSIGGWAPHGWTDWISGRSGWSTER